MTAYPIQTPYVKIYISGVLTTVTLGKVLSEKVSLDNGLYVIPIPTGSSSTVKVINLTGVKKTIYIEGLVQSDTDIDTFISRMTSWANSGLQKTGYYYGTCESNKAVLCDDFTYTWESTSPNALHYTLLLYEGATIGSLLGLEDE